MKTHRTSNAKDTNHEKFHYANEKYYLLKTVERCFSKAGFFKQRYTPKNLSFLYVFLKH